MSDDADARTAALRASARAQRDRAVERARRIGQRWIDDLDELEQAARAVAARSPEALNLLTAISDTLEDAQDFCAELFDPATAPRPEGKADERPLPAVVPAPPGTPGDGRLRRRRAAGGRCRRTPYQMTLRSNRAVPKAAVPCGAGSVPPLPWGNLASGASRRGPASAPARHGCPPKRYRTLL